MENTLSVYRAEQNPCDRDKRPFVSSTGQALYYGLSRFLHPTTLGGKDHYFHFMHEGTAAQRA